MTFRESVDSSVIEAEGICIEIWEPDLIVIPKLDFTNSIGIPLQINVLITNNTTTPFPFINHLLMLEIVGVDAQALHPTRLIDRQLTISHYQGISIPPKQTIIRSLIAQISKANNGFEFQGSIYTSSKTQINPNSSWSFEPLQLKNYQLRFTYISPTEEFSFKDAATGDIITVESSEPELLTSSWVNLRLVEFAEANKKAVEVDGIRFETLVPQPTINVAFTQPEINISVQIGMQITNNTLTPFRFTSFDSLIPFLIGADSLIPSQSYGGSHGWVLPRESDFQLVLPGSSATFFPKVHLVRQTDNCLKLRVSGGGRTSWTFNDLKPGKYQVGLTYRSLTDKPDLLFEDLWVGMVSTPFVEFHLVES
ncbi:hypothetical protein PL8927_840003 [Planktothrix serta PCC 8927]|uniref:Uncharacterized protein n=1 Tax=Planktothrix serta PCC 8927 TaxID=671068 RepID=A0A7Z9BYM7_9CYAN|nr:hypothetical protein [Planktothrix serta]VXD25180.1 hypothetical protein PL8927_840003 [Planktothrix serta PCC 8927]